jgi:hypothetical protein
MAARKKPDDFVSAARCIGWDQDNGRFEAKPRKTAKKATANVRSLVCFPLPCLLRQVDPRLSHLQQEHLGRLKLDGGLG